MGRFLVQSQSSVANNMTGFFKSTRLPSNVHFDSKAGWTGQDFLNGRPRQRQKRVLKFSQVCTRSLIDGLTGLRAAAYVGSAYGHFEETDSPVIPFRRPVQVVRIIERAGLLK